MANPAEYDKVLMERLAGGDPAALAELYDATAAAVFGLVSRFLRDDSAAGETVVQAYADAWREAPYRREGRATTEWIQAIARGRAVVRRFEETTDPALFDVPPMDAPDHLRETVLAIPSREPRPAAVPQPQAPAAAPVVPKFASPEPARRGGQLPWVVASVAIAVAAIGWYRYTQAEEGVGQLKAMVANAQNDAQQLQSMVELERDRTRELEQISVVISTPGSRVIQLVGQESSQSAAAALFWDVEGRKATLNGYFPAAPAGKTYQLWFVSPTARTNIGAFPTDLNGRVLSTFDIPPNADRLTMVGVTLEPAPGSAQPTTRFQAVGTVR